MPTAVWIIYDTIVAVLGFYALDRALTAREKRVVVVLVIAGLMVAGYGYHSDQQDKQMVIDTQQEMTELKKQSHHDFQDLDRRLEASERDRKADSQRFTVLFQNSAATTPPGLKQQAFQLSAALSKFVDTNEPLEPPQPAPFWDVPHSFPDAEKTKENMAKIEKQKLIQDTAYQQFEKQRAAFATDYATRFADRVRDIRANLIQNGRTQWSHASGYYYRPPSAGAIRDIANELATNAQALP